jgi:hypothetical protein
LWIFLTLFAFVFVFLFSFLFLFSIRKTLVIHLKNKCYFTFWFYLVCFSCDFQ